MERKVRKRRWLNIVVCMLCFAMITVGCSKQISENVASDSAGEIAVAPSVASKEGGTYESVSGSASQQYVLLKSSEVSRKIIRHVQLVQKVTDLDEAIEKVMQYVVDAEGYVQSSSIREYGNNQRLATYTLRIPEGNFNPILFQLRSIGKNESMDENGQDVTEEFYDNEARIKNLKLQEEAVQRLLDKAEKMEDILAIQKELFALRSDIEVLEGRNRYLDQLSSMATIDLTIREVKPVEFLEQKEDSALSRAKEGFLDSIERLLTFLVETFVFFVSSLPILIILLLVGGIVYWGLKRLFKRLRYRKTQNDMSKEE